MTKRLYTEANVRELPAGSELVLGREAHATPAALELAFLRGLRVQWSDGSRTPPAGPAVTESLWKKLLGEDGEYVLQVRAGHARVFKLGASGPLFVGEGS